VLQVQARGLSATPSKMSQIQADVRYIRGDVIANRGYCPIYSTCKHIVSVRTWYVQSAMLHASHCVASCGCSLGVHLPSVSSATQQKPL